jgi:hypothetical protein
LVPAASGGAGYDDQNNNGYRNGDVGEIQSEPTCETGKHGRRAKTDYTVEVSQMQWDSRINKTYDGITLRSVAPDSDQHTVGV